MTEYNPEHAECFDAIENIQVVMFVLEYFKRVLGVERLNYF